MKTTKIVSGLMALTMAFGALGLSASAAESAKLAIENKSIEAGKEFSVDVTLSGASGGISSADFAIKYDASVVSDIAVTAKDTGAKAAEGDLGSTLFNTYDNKKGQVTVVWATGLTDSKYWLQDGVVFTVTGKAAAGASGKTTLEIVGADRAVYPGASEKASVYLSAVGADKTVDYTADASAGTLTFGGAVEETTKPADETTKPADETTKPDDGDADWGNADCKDEVDVADAVLICRYSVEDPGAKITAQGLKNADVNHDGKVTGDDAVKVLKAIAHLIDKADLAKKS